MQSTFYKMLLITLLVIAAIYYVWPPVLWSLVLVIPLAGVGFYDMAQEKHSIRRNFPPGWARKMDHGGNTTLHQAIFY